VLFGSHTHTARVVGEKLAPQVAKIYARRCANQDSNQQLVAQEHFVSYEDATWTIKMAISSQRRGSQTLAELKLDYLHSKTILPLKNNYNFNCSEETTIFFIIFSFNNGVKIKINKLLMVRLERLFFWHLAYCFYQALFNLTLFF